MAFTYFDSHSHLNLPDFDADKDAVIKDMEEKSVGTLTVGTTIDSSEEAVRLALAHQNMFACIGLHPNEVGNEYFDPVAFAELLSEKTVAVGECGLDYFRSSNKKEQEREFRKQIDFALLHDLPLMLHIRSSKGSMDAYEDTLTILAEYKDRAGETLRGQAHFFAGTKDIMERFVDLGFYISFTGVITFTGDYDDVVRAVPANRLLAETDSPFVAPVPYRGQRSLPQYVIEIYKRLAELREAPLDDLSAQIRQNLQKLYHIDA